MGEKRKEKEKGDRKKESQIQEEKSSRNEKVDEVKGSYQKERKEIVEPFPVPTPSTSNADVKEEGKTKKYSDRRKEERLKREKEKLDKNKKRDTTTTEVKIDDNIIDIDEDSSKDDEDAVLRPPSVFHSTETASEKSVDSVESAFSEYRKPFRDRGERRTDDRGIKDRRGKRPDMQVYRPGMGKFSSRTIRKDEEEKERQSPKTSPEESRETSPIKKFYDDDRSQHGREFKGRGSKGFRNKADLSDDDSVKGFKTEDDSIKGFKIDDDSIKGVKIEEEFIKGFKTDGRSQLEEYGIEKTPVGEHNESEEVVKSIVDEVVTPISSVNSVISSFIRDEDITPLTAAVSVITIDNDNTM